MGLWGDRSTSSTAQDSSSRPLLHSYSHISDPNGTPAHDEQLYVRRRIQQNPMWTVDRGTGYYSLEREAKKKASLLSSGKETGKSCVLYEGIAWTRILRHVWKRDFFTTVVHMRFALLVPAMFLLYFSTFAVWAIVYYVTWRLDSTCFVGIDGFRAAFLFAIETQQTIGYGTHAIGNCWLPAWLVAVHCIVAVILEATFIGIFFAKLSHPKGRSRTILISECACIARRDGVLKFMFRVADIRKRTVCSPRLRATLYTWPERYVTREGEHHPILVQELPLHYYDHNMLLPVVVEHTIDERSPLYGHTSQSLEAAHAEVVMTFEGINELGDTFMTRRSYLPSEMHWGCMFVNIVHRAQEGRTQHTVDLSRFHDVEPQPSLGLLPPSRLSQSVVMGGMKRVPRARLLENTLCCADDLVICPREGKWFLMARVGDSYPSQMLNVQVRLLLYRYSAATSPEGELVPFSVTELPVTPPSVMLRYPMNIVHELGPESPVGHWVTSAGLMQDADAEVVLSVTALVYASGQPATRSRVYPVLGRVRWGYCFEPCVVPPQLSETGRPRVEWGSFHTVVPMHAEARRGASKHHIEQQQEEGGQWTDPGSQGQPSGEKHWPGQGRSKGGAAQQVGVRTSTEVVMPLDRGMTGCAVTAWLTHHQDHHTAADTSSSAGGQPPAAAAAAAAARLAAEASTGYTPPRLPAGSTVGLPPVPEAESAAMPSGATRQSAVGGGSGSGGGGGGMRSTSTTNSPAWTPNTTLNTRQASVASGGSGNPWARMGFAGGLQQWQQELAAEAERLKQEAAAAPAAAGGAAAVGAAALPAGAGGSGTGGVQEGGAAAGAGAGGAGATSSSSSSSGAGAGLAPPSSSSSTKQHPGVPEQSHSVLTIHKARAEAGPSGGGVAAGAGTGLPPAASATASAPYSLSTASRPVLSNITRSTSGAGAGAGAAGASGSSRHSARQSAQGRQLPEQQQQQEGGVNDGASTAPGVGAGPGVVGAGMVVQAQAWGPDPDDITVCEKHEEDSWHTKRSLAPAMAVLRESMQDKEHS